MPPREAACLLLLAAGADPDASSPIGSPLSIARAPPHPVKRTLCAYSATESSGTILMVRHKRRRAGPGVLMEPPTESSTRSSPRGTRVSCGPGHRGGGGPRGHDASLKAAKALDLASKVASHGLSFH